MKNNKYSWGDSIKVKAEAPIHLNPGNVGEVVGFFEIESNEESEKYNKNVGTYIYLIEFTDGTQIEIPEDFLNFLSNNP